MCFAGVRRLEGHAKEMSEERARATRPGALLETMYDIQVNSIQARILYEKIIELKPFWQKKSGNEVYYAACSLLVILKNS